MTKSEENNNLEKIPNIKGLVLVGGKSSRMGKDKSQMNYFGKPQKEVVKDLLEKNDMETFFSVRPFDRAKGDSGNENVISSAIEKSHKSNEIPDIYPGIGPIGGICAAFQTDPNSAWFVLATDVPFINEEVIHLMLEKRNPNKVATSIKGKNKTFIEPLITIYEPKAYPILIQNLDKGLFSPRKVLMDNDIEIVEVDDNLIRNINTPEEFKIAKSQIDG